MKSELFQLRFLWLAVPPVVLCALDFGLTLYGQSDAYWAGNYSDVNEISPSFAQNLAIHPLPFVAAAMIWIGLFSAIISLLPEALALTLAVAIVLGHMAGAATWFAYRFNNYQACMVLFLTTAFVVVFSFKRGQCSDGSAAFKWERTGLPDWLRWVTVAVLCGLPVYWFLVPH